MTGTLFHSISASSSENPITTLRWRPRAYHSSSPNVLVSGNSEGVITHWHAKSGKYLTQIKEEDNQVLAMDYIYDGRTFATAGKDFKVRLYDESTKSLIHTFQSASWQSPGHGNRIFSLKFLSPDLPILLSGGWDNNVLIWDIRSKNSIGSFFGPNISGDTIDYKDGEVLTGSHRNKDYLELWDLGSRKKRESLSWEDDNYREGAYIYASQFIRGIEGKKVLAACSGLNEVKILEAEGKDRVRSLFKAFGFEKGCYTVDCGGNGRYFGFAGGDGSVYIYGLEEK